MILRVAYGEAVVYYEDEVGAPTPEHSSDVLGRLERTLDRIWRGKAPVEVDLTDYEAGTDGHGA